MNKKQHDLVTIYWGVGSDEQDVVRWCRKCGAIVVDIDIDNRTVPGGIMSMRIPLLMKKNHCLTGS